MVKEQAAARPRYRVEARLGAGGCGTVYLATFLGQHGFRRRVALKVLNAQMSSEPELQSRLRDEARLLGLLSHSGIVGASSLIQISGRWTVVMDYVEGVNLTRLLRSAGPVPLRPATEILAATARALQAAWETPGPEGNPLHLLHRDLKPSNIQLTPHGEVKVLDFGIARAEFAEREAVTRHFSSGTEAYMSPERLRGEDCTHAGDIYALGTVYFELLVARRFGRSPLDPGDHAAKVELCINELRGYFPSWVEVHGLIAQMLHEDPDKRPGVAEVVRQLEGIQQLAAEEESLFAWARSVVPACVAALPADGAQDTWIGQELHEDDTLAPPPLPRTPTLALTVAGLAGLLLISLLVFAVALAIQLPRIAAREERERIEAARVEEERQAAERRAEEERAAEEARKEAEKAAEREAAILAAAEAERLLEEARRRGRRPELPPAVVTSDAHIPPVVATAPPATEVAPPATAATRVEISWTDPANTGTLTANGKPLPTTLPPGTYPVDIACSAGAGRALGAMKVAETAVHLSCDCARLRCFQR